jgi:hypothetical protein
VRDYLIHRVFIDRYTRWICHEENIKTVNNIKNIVRDESRGDDLYLDNDCYT